MNKYPIAICSHGRPEQLRDQTLAFLKRMKVDESGICIYVSNAKCLKQYQRVLKGDYGWEIGGGSLREKRNHIILTRKEGTKLICIDDDLRNIVVRTPGASFKTPRPKQGHFMERGEWWPMVNMGFDIAEKECCGLWGIAPSNNPLFGKDTHSVGLKYITGGFYGTILKRHSDLLGHYFFKEDYERSLRSYRHFGNVVRLEQFGIDTSCFTVTGGSAVDGVEARIKSMDAEIKVILKEFPGLCTSRLKTYQSKPSYTDLKLTNLKRWSSLL